MFIGHFGVGFGAKSFAPRVSLGSLFLASQFLDLLWPTLLLFGVERVRIAPGITVVTPLDFEQYPISHSLLLVVAWGVLVALVYQGLRRYPRGAVVMGMAVVSHWFLDLIVHRPDLPLYPRGPLVGLGLWASLPATVCVELLIFVVGLWCYMKVTTARDAFGKWSLWGLVAILVGIYIGSLSGSPPPSESAVAWVGQAQWLLVLWGYWVDRHRVTVRPD